MMFNKFKNGFTLAEVLITLVIIGVVAALTISAVINTYVERSTISKVKKGLSTVAQAKKLAETHYGPIEGWDFGEGATAQTASDFWKYIKPHLSVVKDCTSNGLNCYQNQGVYFLDGDYYTNYNYDAKYFKFILSDGSVMWFRTGASAANGRCSRPSGGVENVCAVFWHDINGDKSPNTIGKDVFYYIVSVDGVYPSMLDDCNKNSQGWGCSGYIIKNDNMNYLH